MTVAHDSQPTVSRTGTPRKRSSRFITRRKKLQSRRLSLENLEDRRVLYGGITNTINFDLDTPGAKPNGFTSLDSAIVHFTDSNRANLDVVDLGAGQTIGQSLRVQTDGGDSSLIMDFDVAVCQISLAFGNDDPGFSNAGDRAVLTVFDG